MSNMVLAFNDIIIQTCLDNAEHVAPYISPFPLMPSPDIHDSPPFFSPGFPSMSSVGLSL